MSSYLATAANGVFDFPLQHGGLDALVGVYANALQIYADFSGYTDIAIGLALLLGFRFPANFDAPYTATSSARRRARHPPRRSCRLDERPLRRRP